MQLLNDKTKDGFIAHIQLYTNFKKIGLKLNSRKTDKQPN